MSAADVGQVPIAHQGDEREVLERIAAIGSSAWLAFDGARHVGQLQFRLYVPGAQSPNGVWDPLWWMDFGGRAPALDPLTLAICCCHVGQLDDTADRDQRYLGRGIGADLLDHFLEWTRNRDFGAVIAKATPGVRAVMEFLGGFPENVSGLADSMSSTSGWTAISAGSYASETFRWPATPRQRRLRAAFFVCDHLGRVSQPPPFGRR